MCGLAGWVDYTRKLDDEFPAIFAMTDTLALRGPDAEGIWKHRNALLGHRRLAVIDLSGGVQPMSYRFPTGQEVTLVYTGEVYNHDALRERLRRAGHEFRTRSDTEVVLHAYLQWGERCCEYLTGMFAFAVFDGRDGHLLLVRDRLGIKPLYYARHREGLLFGSEIKSILAHPEFAARLDAVGLVDLLTLSRGTSQTPFREVQELLPGHLLSWRPNSQAKLRRYWEVRRQEHADDLQSTVQRTRELVTCALGAQLHADVPVCSLLSGGLDSTALTGIAQRIAKAEHGGDINSFSVDFVGQAEQFRSDDLRPDQDQPFALLAAQYIGSRHRTVLIDNAELVCERAREEVFRAKDVPSTFGDMDTSLHLMFGEIRRHSTVASPVKAPMSCSVATAGSAIRRRWLRRASLGLQGAPAGRLHRRRFQPPLRSPPVPAGQLRRWAAPGRTPGRRQPGGAADARVQPPASEALDGAAARTQGSPEHVQRPGGAGALHRP